MAPRFPLPVPVHFCCACKRLDFCSGYGVAVVQHGDFVVCLCFISLALNSSGHGRQPVSFRFFLVNSDVEHLSPGLLPIHMSSAKHLSLSPIYVLLACVLWIYRCSLDVLGTSSLSDFYITNISPSMQHLPIAGCLLMSKSFQFWWSPADPFFLLSWLVLCLPFWEIFGHIDTLPVFLYKTGIEFRPGLVRILQIKRIHRICT